MLWLLQILLRTVGKYYNNEGEGGGGAGLKSRLDFLYVQNFRPNALKKNIAQKLGLQAHW